jgi:hypothetical protein
MKKPLNYFGHAFDDPSEVYNKEFLKSKKGKKKVKKQIKRNKKYQKELKENGIDRTECWNLDYTIAKFVTPRLKLFKELGNSYPGHFENIEEWHKIIDKMIYSFEQKMADDYANFDQLKYMEGFKLFGEYFHHLWD